MSIYARLIAILAILTAIAGATWYVYSKGVKSGKAEIQAQWDDEKRLALKAREANRETARQAEIRYVDREKVITEFVTVTQKELANESQNLVSCRLDAGDIGLLNKASSTAREN